MFRYLAGVCLAAFAFSSPSTLFAQSATTAEQERLSLIKALQKRLPGTGPGDWQLGPAAFAGSDGDIVQSIPFNDENATNSADILAIGKKLWDRKFKNGKSFSHCFANSGKQAAATYPQFDARTKVVVTLEIALNRCLALHGESEIELGSEAMSRLLAYARSLSEGQRMAIKVSSAAAKEKFDAGQALFTRRIGQNNFACASCHVLHAGKPFGQAEPGTRERSQPVNPIAVGQAVSWPRLEPKGLVLSPQALFQRCMQRSGAEPFILGSEELNNLEYFYSFLSNGMPIRTLGTAR
ncbi:MAG: sulfur oxidation c-type cytochrome SoxA [Betaproteobacteria bacterium]|nr:sulfur oxidation c-type cytochrome SoxA [Betaproteobacteria bacterium]